MGINIQAYTTAPPKRRRRRRVDPNSRAARWATAVGNARTALDGVQALKDDFDAAMGDLRDLQQEYQDWLDNLPEGLQGSPVGEKLQAMVDMDLEPDFDIDAASEAVENADSADLPLGWGRD